MKRILVIDDDLNMRETIRDVLSGNDYDIIISIATLHFLPEDKINKVIDKIKKHTKKGGLNLITVFPLRTLMHEFAR